MTTNDRAAEPDVTLTSQQQADWLAGKLHWSDPPIKAILQTWVDTAKDGWYQEGGNSQTMFMDEFTLFEQGTAANVWGLLSEFGDAEIATLIAPRGLVVEHSEGRRVEGPPALPAGRTEHFPLPIALVPQGGPLPERRPDFPQTRGPGPQPR